MRIEGIKKRYEAAIEEQIKTAMAAIIHNYGEIQGADKIWMLYIEPARTDIPDLIAEAEKLEVIESDLNNTIGFMQTGIDDWKAEVERLRAGINSVVQNLQGQYDGHNSHAKIPSHIRGEMYGMDKAINLVKALQGDK